MTNLRVALAVVMVTVLPMVGGPAAPAEAAPIGSVGSELLQVFLRVDGLTCGGCAISARIVLMRLDGVERALVDYERRRAVVTYDPTKVTPAAMIAALKETLGYTATVIEGVRPR